jgi:hypothetical protein
MKDRLGLEQEMEATNLATNAPLFRDHLQAVGLLMITLPVLAFVSMKVWGNARATAKARRRTQWIVSKDPVTGEPICDHKSFMR